MKSRRSFLALVATAFICSMSTLSPAHAAAGGGNTLNHMAKQGGKYHSTTLREAKKAKKEKEEKEAKKKKEKPGE